MISIVFRFVLTIVNFLIFFVFLYFAYAILVSAFFAFVYFSDDPRASDRITSPNIVHPVFSKTKWDQVKPCGAFFDEKFHFEKTKVCANLAFSKESKKTIPNTVIIPRCFVISKSSSDIAYSSLFKMNAAIVKTLMEFLIVVGLYEPTDRTIFLIENHDLPMIYRHELQHYFQHLLDPKLIEKNHEGLIWDICEPRKYVPSEDQIKILELQEKNLFCKVEKKLI